MFEHLSPLSRALPPPATPGREPRRGERDPSAATVVGTVIVSTLAIVLALAVIASLPTNVLAPTVILLAAGLMAGSLAIHPRPALARRPVGSRFARRPGQEPDIMTRSSA